MAAEWPQYLQSVIFGVVSSFLLAKLFSVIFSFHEEDLRITRSHQTESESNPLSSSDRVLEETAAISDDEWEGVESTELDETFSAATAFVAAMAADGAAQKVSNEVQLQLYGLYKIATEGPCSDAQPSAFKMTARAKWQEIFCDCCVINHTTITENLLIMPPEEAMQKYIGIVTGLYPSWPASSLVKKNGEESSHASSAGSKGTMGPVLSTFIYEEEPESELKMEAIHRLQGKEMKRSCLSAF